MSKRQWLAVLGLVISLRLPGLVFGQGTTAVISGVVSDPSLAVISGATITVTNTQTGISRTTQSDSAGRYRVGELQPGTYQVTVTMAGFATQTRRNLVLQVGQEVALNFALQVGPVEQLVEVTAEVPLVETSTAVVSHNVTQEQLRELPLNGRSFTDLVTLNPGTVAPTQAVQNPNYTGGPQLSVSGARTDANSFMIDGTDMGITSNGTPGSAAGVQLGVDTILEYQVITSNPRAEYGRSSGGVINAVTRSGTNEWHGAVFEFIRNSALDARNFFDAKVLPFKRNQFGATFGGPIQRDKTFFFLGYEGLRQRLQETSIWTVPTAAARQGVGFLNPGEAVNSKVVPYLNLYPLPNGRDLGAGAGEFIETTSQPVGENYGSARVDHNFSSSDFLFVRYTSSRGFLTQSDRLLSDASITSASHYATAQYDHIFSPTLLNMFRVGYNRTVNNLLPADVPNALALSFGLGRPMGSLTIGSGFNPIGPNQILYLEQTQNIFQFDDQLTWTRGAHTMKFGAMIERFRWNTDQQNNSQGNYSFSNFRNFLLGGPSGVSATTLEPGSITYRHFRTTMLGFFTQDDYRVTPRLTLNLGLRWEFTTGLNEIDGYASYLRRGPELSDVNDLVLGELWINRIGLLQPRLGFNWGLDESGKTALSGGIGIFHNQILHQMMIAERIQLPFIVRGSASNVSSLATFPNIYATVATNSLGGFTSTESRHFDHDNFKTPTFYRYNLTLQRELPGAIALRVGYVGATGFHTARNQTLNRFPVPVVRTDGSLFFPGSPVPQFINPNYGLLTFQSSDSNSWYSALTASLQKRWSKGLTFQASYTYSKSLDDLSNSDSNLANESRSSQFAWDRSLDRARSAFNVPHVFVINGLYELPLGTGKPWINAGGVANAILGGWQVGGILTLQQGIPLTVSAGSNSTSGYQFTASRPNLKPGVDINKITRIPSDVKGSGAAARLFDATVFEVPPPGTIGNASRTLLLGPALSNVNFTLSKSFHLREQMRLQFRSEFFNLFNHTNFGRPSSAVFSNAAGTISPAAGRITSTSTKSRQIQFALKLTF